jgi:cupin superfamily acireductone dioxygenase involved in methionine salvage
MAIVSLLQGIGGELTEDAEIAAFLGEHQILFERWPIPEEIQSLAKQPLLNDEEKSEVLGAFRPRLEELAETQGTMQLDHGQGRESADNRERGWCV